MPGSEQMLYFQISNDTDICASHTQTLPKCLSIFALIISISHQIISWSYINELLHNFGRWQAKLSCTVARFCQHSRIPLHLLLMFTSQTPKPLRKLPESQRKLPKHFTNSKTTTQTPEPLRKLPLNWTRYSIWPWTNDVSRWDISKVVRKSVLQYLWFL